MTNPSSGRGGGRKTHRNRRTCRWHGWFRGHDERAHSWFLHGSPADGAEGEKATPPAQMTRSTRDKGRTIRAGRTGEMTSVHKVVCKHSLMELIANKHL